MSATLDELIREGTEKKASDLHIVDGRAPILRIDGELIEQEQFAVFSEKAVERVLEEILSTNNYREKLDHQGHADLAWSVGDQRLRVNIFSTSGKLAAALRLIDNRIPNLNELGLPIAVANLASSRRGLILVTGPTGSGKSTTHAAMIAKINAERGERIISVEDPIEYLHKDIKSVISQREIGSDVPDFSTALTGAMREDPDVILIGEMRDVATMRIALEAAETGHLVLATVHAPDAQQSVERIVNSFGGTEQAEIRTQLAGSLSAIISQQLLPAVDGGRRALACEIMIANAATRNLIRESNTHQMRSSIQTGGAQGMQTMDSDLARLAKAGRISSATAIESAIDRDSMVKELAR